MVQMNTRIDDFLRTNGFDEHTRDSGRLLAGFAAEMAAGLAGEPSSLPMIPAYLSVDRPVPADKPVIVLDAGGTNLRVGVVQFDAAGTPHISRFSRHKMPGATAPISADDFFNTLADLLMPVVDAAETIGFCFSYRRDHPGRRRTAACLEKQIQAPREGAWWAEVVAAPRGARPQRRSVQRHPPALPGRAERRHGAPLQPYAGLHPAPAQTAYVGPTRHRQVKGLDRTAT